MRSSGIHVLLRMPRKYTFCRRCCSLIFGMIWLCQLSAQKATIFGTISSGTESLTGASVVFDNGSIGTVSDASGKYLLANLPEGEHQVQVSYLGYKVAIAKVVLRRGEEKNLDFNLQEDILGLEAIVVTGTRNALPVFLSPVMVNRLDDRIFRRTQSISLAEGLHFSPGLRIENNCQNCGFTQLRMNGLDGPYTQILINSRPVFSALAGVYGLEMIPTNMVERVEIVRGGGSALYGGNAIAGTVNIITKDPLFNYLEFNSNLALTNLKVPDRSLSVNGSLVSQELDRGVSFFGFNRKRLPWDANGDALSEMTLLDNLTMGADGYWKPTEDSRLSWNLLFMNEFRRGGGDFDLPPHQAAIAEQLDHGILGTGISYERYTKDKSRKVSFYGSLQQTSRGSYYGAGGGIPTPGTPLSPILLQALNAYGKSDDLALAVGWQYAADFNGGLSITLGNEWIYNKVSDRMPGYGRQINQTVNSLGTYVQVQYKPSSSWTLLAGGRFDPLTINGDYQLVSDQFIQRRTLLPVVPRISILKNINTWLKTRVSYSEGYRAPQAFNEDLHLETVGGAALFTRLDDKLRTETSQSLNASLDMTWQKGSAEGNIILDAFHIRLKNPFILSDQEELPSGIAVVTKRNGSGARVFGVNLESNLAITSKWVVQAGATLQRALYAKEELIWSPAFVNELNRDSMRLTNRLLRTPNLYGFFSLDWKPTHPWSFSLSGVYTGSMQVKHIIDPDTEFLEWVTTPSFLEVNMKFSREWHIGKDMSLNVSLGLQNIFNAYQNDFDSGITRDAGYVYGPSRPRTLFLGITFSPFHPE